MPTMAATTAATTITGGTTTGGIPGGIIIGNARIDSLTSNWLIWFRYSIIPKVADVHNDVKLFHFVDPFIARLLSLGASLLILQDIYLPDGCNYDNSCYDAIP